MTPFLILLSVSFIVISSTEGARSVEDLEIDRQLKILNRPYIKSIKTVEGDIFDCIDIYKQPAFDHPLLKNHSIQLKPSAFPDEMREADETSPLLAKLSAVGLSEACPFGTVPIKRTRKEDLIWAKMFAKNSLSNSGSPYHFYRFARHFIYNRKMRKRHIIGLKNSHATAILPGSPGKLYLGAGARINTQNPQVTNTQFSIAFVQIQSGVEVIGAIQAGWMVNPRLYGDNATRTFGAWTAGNGTGCFNMLCSGFIQVNSEFPLGYVISEISEYDGDQYYINFKIFKDIQSGNWWLGHDGLNKRIGYWPNSLFSSLSSYATQITWGGVVLTDNNAASPPMGSGHFAGEGYARAAYQRELQIVDQSNKLIYVDDDLLQYDADIQKCYSVEKLGTDYGFLYGGPGGICEG